MTYDELPELHYITPIENLASILKLGILSHKRADQLEHESVSMDVIQDKRANKQVPGARPLHDYVNMYFHARNPMMFKRRARHEKLCVLSIRREVVRQPGVVVTDMNASSDYVRFSEGVKGLDLVDAERVYARYWTHPNRIHYLRHKAVKCAEVLVPDRVDTTYVRGVYVSCKTSETKVNEAGTSLTMKVSPDLFFQTSHG